MLLFLLLSALFAGSFAQVALLKNPDFQPVKNFDTSKYLGTWYVISTTPNPFEIDQKCTIIGYNNHLKTPMIVYLASTDIKNGEYSRFPASYTQRVPHLAQWDFRFPANSKDSNGVSTVLATDYISYAVEALVQPADNGKSGYDLVVRILSREKTLSKYFDKIISDVLDRNNISSSILRPVDQSYCHIQ